MSHNESLFDRAQRSTPGGVNSPVRAFRSVGGTPRFITRAEGPYFWDADESIWSIAGLALVPPRARTRALIREAELRREIEA
ncbi:MAG: hypothetical protein RLZ64_1575, partial [Pseudomonadota bacterium]